MPLETILDNYALLSDQPDGLNDLEIKFTRDELFKGVFVKYSSKLIFSGDGYDYLKSKIDSDGVCATVDAQFRDPVTENIYYGTIFLQSSKLNLSNCTIECAIEDNSLQQRVLRQKNQKIDVSSQKTLNGFSITPIGSVEDIAIYTDYPVFTGTSNIRKIWGARSTVNYMLNWIADNNITLVTNGFFNTVYTNWVKKVVVGGSFTLADTISYTITTCYGTYSGSFQPATVYFPFNALLGLQLSRELSNKIGTNFVQIANKEFYQSTAQKVMYGYSVGGDAYLVHYDDFELTITSDGLSTFTITDEQNGSYGGNNTYLTNGKSLLSDNGAPDEIYASDVTLVESFNNIFGELSKLFCLGLFFYKQGDTQFCQIETLFDLYFDNVSIEVNYINDLTQEFDTEQQITSIDTGAANGFTDWGQLNPQSFTNRSDCFSREVNATTQWILGGIIFDNLDFINVNDIVPFIFNAGQGRYCTNFRATYIDNAGTLVPDTVINDYQTVKVSSQNCAASFVAQAWAKTGATELVCSRQDGSATRTLTIADAILIDKSYSFTVPLTCEQLSLIENNPLSKIAFSTTAGDLLSGWIKEVSYNINTGLAKIKIYST